MIQEAFIIKMAVNYIYNYNQAIQAHLTHACPESHNDVKDVLTLNKNEFFGVVLLMLLRWLEEDAFR